MFSQVLLVTLMHVKYEYHWTRLALRSRSLTSSHSFITQQLLSAYYVLSSASTCCALIITGCRVDAQAARKKMQVHMLLVKNTILILL